MSFFDPVPTRAARQAVPAHPALLPSQLLALARQYVRQSTYRPEEPVFWPAYQSFGHATELMLKAYLAWKLRKTERELRGYGHNILRLLTDSEANGLAPRTDRERWLLEKLDDIHAEMWARYVKNHSAPVVAVHEFDAVVNNLFTAVCTALGETPGWPKF